MQPGDSGLAAAVGSALAMGLPLLALVVSGHPEAAVFAAFGAFTGLYGDDRPYRFRARTLAGVGAGFVGAVTLGSLSGLLLPDGWWVLAVAVVAAVAKWGCDRARVGTPGAWMFLFAFAASTQVPTRAEDVVVRALLAAAGAAVASGVAMLGALGDPGGPERRAAAAALRRTAQVLGLGSGATPRDWHAAHAALERAERCAGAAAPAARPPLLRLLHQAEGLLTDAVLAPEDPRVAAQAGLLLQDCGMLRRPAARRPRRRRTGRAGADPAADVDARWSPPPDVRRAREQQARHVAVLRLLTAARVFLGAGVAGAAALTLGLGHPYWAPVSAAAVLQATHVRMTWHRSIQRGLGTAAGLLLGALLLAAHPDPVLIAALVVLMQLGIEVFIRRNYALGVLFITPMTMLLSDLLVPSSTYSLVVDRLGGVALGIVVGLAAALVVSHPRAAVTLRHAVDRCELAMTWARSAPRVRLAAATEELRDALVDLRAAEDVARGEAWPAGIPRAAVAETEGRAYRTLATCRRVSRSGQSPSAP